MVAAILKEVTNGVVWTIIMMFMIASYTAATNRHCSSGIAKAAAISHCVLSGVKLIIYN